MKHQDRITGAFTTLREQMLSLAERITGNRDDAADAVQDAFVKLWQQRGHYHDNRHARGAAVITVRTTSIDIARNKNRQADVPLENAESSSEDVTDESRELTYRQVLQIIDNDLSHKQRLIIDLREMQGLEFDEIAKRLGTTAANVRVELSRARKRVREIYQSRKKETEL